MRLTPQQQDSAKRIQRADKITQLTIAFIKMEPDKNMVFTNQGAEAEAKKLVQCMRVRLSRMRTALKSQGKQPKDFKMNLLSYVFNEVTGETEITLTKTAPIAKIESEILALIDESLNSNHNKGK